MKVKMFNGFVPNAFEAKHQTSDQMQNWISRLRAVAPVEHFRTQLQNCWAYDMVRDIGPQVRSADHPNEPADRYASPQDAVISQIVLCQRFQWLSDAAAAQPDVDIWAWVEPTIFKQRGVTEPVIERFLNEVEDAPFDAISLPGIWPKQLIADCIAHWRFAGSVWVCPAKHAKKVTETMRTLITLRTRLTNRLCWDMSSWAYAELLNILPMRWYPGNHDETQFTGYLKGDNSWPLLSR